MKRPTRRLLLLVVLSIAIFAGIKAKWAGGRQEFRNLSDAKRGFKTVLLPLSSVITPKKTPVEQPPSDTFLVTEYPSEFGTFKAYLTPDPNDGVKHPAIIWLVGGDVNSIGNCWNEAPVDNDQTARAYRDKGIVMLFPSLRGGNENPGRREGMVGEVDDVLHAAAYLSSLPYVDASRIYLGGHSTGGTLALLIAEHDHPFRAIFSFGPAVTVRSYGENEYFDGWNKEDDVENLMRSSFYWINSITVPTFILEGQFGNPLQAFKEKLQNQQVTLLEIPGADHFSYLAAANKVLAEKIMADRSGRTNLSLKLDEFVKDLPQLP